MIVRNANLEDYDLVTPLGIEFIKNSPMGHVDFDEYSFKSLFESMVKGGSFWVLVSGDEVVGICGALAFPLYFNSDYLLAQELFWYVDPDHRGSGYKLLNSLEEWAKDEGVHTIHMFALEDKSIETMKKVYAKKGYHPIERTFSKELKKWQ